MKRHQCKYAEIIVVLFIKSRKQRIFSSFVLCRNFIHTPPALPDAAGPAAAPSYWQRPGRLHGLCIMPPAYIWRSGKTKKAPPDFGRRPTRCIPHLNWRREQSSRKRSPAVTLRQSPALQTVTAWRHEPTPPANPLQPRPSRGGRNGVRPRPGKALFRANEKQRSQRDVTFRKTSRFDKKKIGGTPVPPTPG